MKINETIKLKVNQVNMEGKTIEKVHQAPLIFEGAILGEVVEVKATKRIKEGMVGEITKIIQASPTRVKNPCQVRNCGGCDYLHMNAMEQATLKMNQLIDLFREAQYSIRIQDILTMESPFAYRNKSIMSFQTVKKKTLFGFYQKNSHYVVDVDQCLMHDEITNQIFNSIKQLIAKYKIEIYDEDKKSGLLRHVLIRRAIKTNQTLVCLVVAHKNFKGSNNFAKAIIAQNPSVTTIVMNVNARSSSVVLGNEEKVLFGKGFIVDELCGNTYRISANSFYQINHSQTERLYETAINLLNLSGQETVFDMYCGIGTIGMTLANKVKEVIGVEINKQAILDATVNAKMNRITNIKFVCQDASTFMQHQAANHRSVDVVIMDPPRSGSDATFIESLVSMNPKQVLYISCNPVTQVRDLLLFKQFGYITNTLYPVDLFPNSCHVESVVKLVRNK